MKTFSRPIRRFAAQPDAIAVLNHTRRYTRQTETARLRLRSQDRQFQFLAGDAHGAGRRKSDLDEP